MHAESLQASRWLRRFYFVRAAFSITWILAAIMAAGHAWAVALLVVLYPAWDALANFRDAKRNGGLRANRSQALNVIISSIMTAALAAALTRDWHTVLAVFGLWAILSGGLQLFTATRRWRRYGAQTVMFLSGAQSSLVGCFMISKALAAAAPSVADLIPYVGFGATYFLISAIWLSFTSLRPTSLAE